MAVYVLTVGAAAVAAVAALLFASWLKMVRKDRVHLPPGPPPLPVIGNLLALKNPIHRSLREIGLRYSAGLFRLHLGHNKIMVIVTGEPVVRQMVALGPTFNARPYGEVIGIYTSGSRGMAFAEGEQWLRCRRVANEILLTHGRSTEAVPEINAEIDHLLDSLDSFAAAGRVCDLKEQLVATSVNLYSSLAFGGRLGDTAAVWAHPVVQDLVRLFYQLGQPNPRDLFPLLKRLPSPQMGALRAARQRVDAHLQDILHRHQATLDREHPSDMVDHRLVAAEAAGLAEADTKQIMSDIFMGSAVPAAMFVVWGILVLINHPPIYRRVQAELDAHFAGQNIPTTEQLVVLPYFRAFGHELMRLYATSPITPRRATENVQLAGYHIPADTDVFINYFVMQTDPAFWPDPFVFDPDRHLQPQPHQAPPHPPLSYQPQSDTDPRHTHYMPFGTGPRKCPGEPIAETELPLILSRLLLHFEFSSPDGPGTSVPMDEVLGLALEPVRSLVRVTRRTQPIAPSTAVET